MKVVVLGSGNGAHAVAFEWARVGHKMYMFDFEQFPKSIAAINKAGGIYAEGEMEGFQKVEYAGHDISKVVPYADSIFAVEPAYSTKPFGKVWKPYIKPGQKYVIYPSSCAGSIVFKNALGLDIEDESVLISETSTLPYAVRIIGDAKISVYNRLKGGYFIAALPTNAALIERTHGNFFFYEDGVKPAVGRVMKAVDDERIAIGKKLGVTVFQDPVLEMDQGYQLNETYDIGYATASGFKKPAVA